MHYYYFENGNLTFVENLYSALNLNINSKNIVSIVGGGGKTTILYALAQELTSLGQNTAILTSTHIYVPNHIPVVTSKTSSDDFFEKQKLVAFGEKCQNSKLTIPKPELLKSIFVKADQLLIEADGSKKLPLKVPAEHEPVILPQTTKVIAVVGLDSIGKSIQETCHRPELAAAFLKKEPGQPVTVTDIASIVSSEVGLHKNVSKFMEFNVLLNKADNKLSLSYAKSICELLQKKGFHHTIVTSFRKEDLYDCVN